MYRIPEYVFSARFSSEEKCFIGSVREFPELRILGKDVSATINQLKTAVRAELDTLFMQNKPFPEPVAPTPRSE